MNVIPFKPSINQDEPTQKPPSPHDGRPVRLIFLLGGQVLIGAIAELSLDDANSGDILVLTPREILVTPRPDEGADIHMIPFGHVAGIQIATVQMLSLKRSQYLAVAQVDDPKLEAKFRSNQNAHQSF